MKIVDIATEAAARLNLTRGRDNKWRGRCPACGYPKPTLEVAVQQDRLAISCSACGGIAGIAAVMGVPRELVIAPIPRPSNVARALEAWHRATPAAGSLAETYLKTRGITLPPPLSIRFLPRQRNWNDGQTYSAMISLVQRVPGDDDHSLMERAGRAGRSGSFAMAASGSRRSKQSASSSPSPRASRRRFPSCRLRSCRQSRHSARQACGRCDGRPRFGGCGSLQIMMQWG